jgi:hypothetical protein
MGIQIDILLTRLTTAAIKACPPAPRRARQRSDSIYSERERRPVVEKIIAAANASSYWYERLAEKMMLEPWQLAYDYMTRSGRMTDKRLR